MKFALAQMTSSNVLEKNLADVLSRLNIAKQRGADAVLFPENVFFIGDAKDYARVGRQIIQWGYIALIQEAAKKLSIAVLIGSYIEFDEKTSSLFNTSLWIDERGVVLAKYRKIHLFDVITPSGQRYQESKNFRAGKRLTHFRWRGLHLALTICYDVRFPEQFQRLAKLGVQGIMVPSAFTQETGQAHWHTLLRARAIENFSYIFAPAQSGTHATGRKTYGHSLAINPWGEVKLDAKKKRGIHVIDVDFSDVARWRKQFGWKKK